MIDYKTISYNDFERGKVFKTTYSNGGTLVFHQTKKLKGSSLTIWFNVGSRDEKKNQVGLCHLLEHMIFKGGSFIKGKELLLEMESMGAEINGFTSKEHVCFELSCLSTDLFLLLPKFLDLILNPSFNEKEFSLEKKVVLQEIRDDELDSDLYAEEMCIKKCFNYDLGHPIAGNVNQVGSYSIRHLKNFYNKYYNPSRMVISICADVDLKNLQKLLGQSFFDQGKTKAAKPIRRKLKNTFGKIEKFNFSMNRHKGANALLLLSTKGISSTSDYRGDLLLLSHYLGEGLSSRFFRELREEKGLLYSVSCGLNQFSDNGNFMISLNAMKKNLKKIEQNILDILGDISINGIGQKRLKSCKRQILSGLEIAFDDPEEICHHVGKCEILGKKPTTFKEITKMINDVSEERLKYVTQEIIANKFSKLVVE